MERAVVRRLRTTAAGLASLLVLAAALFLDVRPAHAATFTVTNTDATGPGSLERAIRDANDNDNAPTVDVIRFDIPDTDPNCDGTTDVCTIAPGTTLPQIAEPVTIDGYTQPGAAPATSGAGAALRIELSGEGTGAGAIGLVVRTSDSTVRGLAINRWTEAIRIDGATSRRNRITGNYLGMDPFGTQALGASLFGVVISGAANNTVGGTSPATRNVISANDQSGVAIFSPTARANKVTGNFIGTDSTGTDDLGNGSHGVFVYDAAAATTIGGPASGARNVISGNDDNGVAIGSGATATKVFGNYIGTDVTGSIDVGNTLSGVDVFDADGVTIGGTDADDGNVDGLVKARNVISGNEIDGVQLRATTAARILGNFIGTKANGTEALGNSRNGVALIDSPANTIGGTSAGARNVLSGNGANGVFIGPLTATFQRATENRVVGNYIGTTRTGAGALGNLTAGVRLSAANDNTIGGSGPAANVIAFNTTGGVIVSGQLESESTGNSILSNSIHDNLGLGIDLGLSGQDGVTPNDDLDADRGPNGRQNFPVLSTAARSGPQTIVEGTLSSSVVKAFTIQFFSSPTADPSGNGEGSRFLGQTSVTTDANGDVSFSASMPAVPVGQVVTATATKQKTGDTSEFSAAVPVT